MCRMMMMCALVAATLATGPEVAAMKVRRLGRTGLKVSVIGVRTWQLGGEWGRRFTQPEVDRLLGRALGARRGPGRHRRVLRRPPG